MVRPKVTVCWAAKGGSGTTVVTAALGLASSSSVTMIDLAGDLPTVLGLNEPAGPGAYEWLTSEAPGEQLADLAVPVTSGVRLIPAGHVPDRSPGREPGGRVERWQALVDALLVDADAVIVDAGTGPPPPALHDTADRSLLVTRACYLALRRAVACPTRPTGVVLVAEPGRALRAVDVETAIGAPVLATVSIDPAVARAVDAGLLVARLPRVIRHELRGAA